MSEITQNQIQAPTFWEETKTLTKLAIPVCLGQIAGLSMTFVDTVMSGRAGAIHMAAVAVASSIWMPVTLFGQGLLMPLIPMIAEKIASATPEKRIESATQLLAQGYWYASIIALCIVLTLLALIKGLSYMTFDVELIALSSDYLLVMLSGVFPLMFYLVERYFLEGQGFTRPTMFIGFLSLAVNIPLNYIFIFGKFGMPALGAVGCAVASAVVCFVMWIGMFYFVLRKNPRAYKLQKPDFKLIKKIFFIALPNAIALLLEISIFSLVAILIAPFGRDIVAGHQVALNVSSMFFMLPLALCVVSSMRTGHYIGLNSLESSKVVRKACLTLALIIGFFNFSMIYFFRDQIASLYTADPKVHALATSFMIFAAVYQIVDCIQIASTGILRGYNDTKALLVLAVTAYWLIAFPVGYSLCFYGIPFISEPIGAYGFWIGMVIGLGFASILFTSRVLKLEKKSLDEILKNFFA